MVPDGAATARWVAEVFGMRLGALTILSFMLLGAPLGAGAPSPAPSSAPACEFRMNVFNVVDNRVALRFFTSGPSGPRTPDP